MRRTSFADSQCPIARTVDLIGDWWTPLVVREAFYGVRRFDDMQQALGIGRNVLTERLRRLVKEGLLARSKYQDHPERFEYHLTEKGQELLPVLATMIQWGEKWLRSSAAPAFFLRHRACGERLHVAVICGECRAPLSARDVEVVPSQGGPAPRASGKRGARGERARRGGAAAGLTAPRRGPARSSERSRNRRCGARTTRR